MVIKSCMFNDEEEKMRARRNMKILTMAFGTKASFCEPVVSVTRSCEMTKKVENAWKMTGLILEPRIPQFCCTFFRCRVLMKRRRDAQDIVHFMLFF